MGTDLRDALKVMAKQLHGFEIGEELSSQLEATLERILANLAALEGDLDLSEAEPATAFQIEGGEEDRSGEDGQAHNR